MTDMDLTSSMTYADDLHVGDVTRFGTYIVTEEEIIAFASQWDPQFIHIDPDRSQTEGHFEGLIASGVQTLAIYQRLSVLSRSVPWHVIGGTGIERVRFRRPVRPGDTLTGQSVIGSIRFDMAKTRALVTFNGELRNQKSDPVFALTMSAYLETRPDQNT